MISPRVRLVRALKGEPVDRPPFIGPGGMMNVAIIEAMQQIGTFCPEAHRDPRAMARLALGVQRLTGIENLGVPFCMTVEAEAMGAGVTMGTPESEPRVTAYPLTGIAGWTRLPQLNPASGRAGVVVEANRILLAEQDDDLPVIANLTGPVTLATSLIEPMILFRAMGKEPRAVHDFLDFITGNLIGFGRALLGSGAHILTIADPSASGEILGPRRFAEFALPYLNRMLDAFSGLSQANLVHICGRLQSIFPEIAQLQVKAMSIDSTTGIARFSKSVPDKAIVGNISTHLLLGGKPEQVQSAALSCLRRGVAVLAPACGLSPRTPLVNLQAMARAAIDRASPSTPAV